MIFKDNIKFVIKSLVNRRVRSFLTVITVILGIMAVVSLMSLGEGVNNALSAELDKLGDDIMFVQSKGGTFGVGGATSFSDSDINAVERVNEVNEVTGYTFKVAKIQVDEEEGYESVIGVPLDKRELVGKVLTMDIEKGRYFKSSDKYKVVLGIDYNIEGKVFEDSLKVGDKIFINDIKFSIIGFWERIGNPADDQSITMPIETLWEIYETEEYSALILDFKGGDIDSVEEDVKKSLRNKRNLDEGKENFEIQTPEQLAAQFGSLINIIQSILVGIALVSLIIGGIGITNTMYTSVLERTKQIGVMKAIGAKKIDIIFIFLTESVIVSMIGGLIGMFIGFSIAFFIEFILVNVFDLLIFNVQLSAYLIIVPLIFSAIIGLVGGILPSLRAANIKIVDTLRYE